MHRRSLITGIVTAFCAVFVLAWSAFPAVADEAAPTCVATDGSIVAAPAGTSAGAPAPCPAGWPAPAQAPSPPATPETPASPAPAPQEPATQPDPGASTETPAAGTPEPQDVEEDAVKSKPKVEGKTKPHNGRKHRPMKRKVRGERRRAVGPDDGNPPPPPKSLLEDPPANLDANAPLPPAGTGGGTDPQYVLASPSITRGIPNILLDQFRVPPFLLPIYQAAGVEYGIRWEVLAAINAIETDYGRNLSVSSAGAMGWMQFMPGTWATYGVDANNDGRKDPYNPVDAIFAAARYLKAAGAGESLQKAIFSYNHAQWYVDDVLKRARALSALPAEVIGSLSGLTLGRFPVAAEATYAGRIATRGAKISGPSASIPVESDAQRRGMRIYAGSGSPVVAVQDARVIALGTNDRLGRFVRVRDAYGNTYTYAHLASVAATYPVPKPKRQSDRAILRELGLKPAVSRSTRARNRAILRNLGIGPAGPTPARDTAAGRRAHARAVAFTTRAGARAASTDTEAPVAGDSELAIPAVTPLHPETATRDQVRAYTQEAATTQAPETEALPAGVTAFKAYFSEPYGLHRDDVVLRPLRRGSHVIGGTILGRVGRASIARSSGADAGDRRAASAAAQQFGVASAPHLYFEIRPAGRKSPRIDPKPILDGWRLLDSTAIYRARNPLTRGDGPSKRLTIGQIMLMSKQQLVKHVLDSPDIEIYECGRRDIRAGIVDRRVLATLEFLAAKGMKPTITSLRCGHGFYTTSGNVSEHSFGSAVDIAAINGTPIIGHQGPGSITDKAVRQLLTLQGTMKPHQIITLMQYQGADNTLALSDHDDHIHVGFDPSQSESGSALKPKQWDRLVNGLERIRNPIVPVQPSKFSIKVTKHATAAAARAQGDRRRDP